MISEAPSPCHAFCACRIWRMLHCKIASAGRYQQHGCSERAPPPPPGVDPVSAVPLRDIRRVAGCFKLSRPAPPGDAGPFFVSRASQSQRSLGISDQRARDRKLLKKKGLVGPLECLEFAWRPGSGEARKGLLPLGQATRKNWQCKANALCSCNNELPHGAVSAKARLRSRGCSASPGYVSD